MTTKRKQEFPDPPEEFRSDLDLSDAFRLGMVEVKKHGVDDSGARKAAADARRSGWAVHVHGGNLTAAHEEIQGLMLHRAELDAKREKFVVRGDQHLAAEKVGEIASADQGIARLRALVDAAPDALLADQRAKKQALDRAREALARAEGDLRPYLDLRGPARQHLAPTIREFESKVVQAQRAFTAAEKEFEDGRATLYRLNEAATKDTQRAYSALATSLGNVLEKLGKKARTLVLEEDIEHLARFPQSAPDEIVALYREAMRVSGIMDRLDYVGMVQFWKACGDVEEIVREKCEADMYVTGTGRAMEKNAILSAAF